MLEGEEGDQGLRHMLLEVAAGRVWVLQGKPPEPDEVGLRRSGPQVVVERPPEEDREEDVEPEGKRQSREVNEPEDEYKSARNPQSAHLSFRGKS